MNQFNKITTFGLFFLSVLIQSCTTIESTVNSTIDSISEAGDFLYDSVNFWEDEEPEQSEAVVIEEAVEVPDYALPDMNYFEDSDSVVGQPQNMQSNLQPQPYYDPIYRSARQYYFVGPNGTPMLAPPPPPFPQYSIDQAPPMPYSYSNSLGIQGYTPIPGQPGMNPVPNIKSSNKLMTLEEEMELFGIQNDCVRVKEDYVNGGFMCDDYD
tara:strand:+ start:507 stop:1139 length:633 start_codon:yes stop_codon:yes gene_type:complete